MSEIYVRMDLPSEPDKIRFGDLEVVMSGVGSKMHPKIQASLTRFEELVDYVKKQPSKEDISVRLQRGMFTVACFPFSVFQKLESSQSFGDLEIMAHARVNDLNGLPYEIALFHRHPDGYLYVGWIENILPIGLNV